MENGLIIGVSGFAGSGKDQFTNFLLDEAEEDEFIKIALADPIKRYAQQLWGFSDEQLWGESKNRVEINHNISPRSVLQGLGEAARNLDEDVYIRSALNIAKTLLTEDNVYYKPEKGLFIVFPSVPFAGVIITDARYSNEILGIKAAGGKLIRIKRNSSGLTGQFAKHQSEIEMLNVDDSVFDFVVDNNGTLEDLKKAAKSIYKALKSG